MSGEVQSLLFDRDRWTVARAKQWAKKNGYLYGAVHETDRYIRLRQFDPRPQHRKRIVTFSRPYGIKAIISWPDLRVNDIDAVGKAVETTERLFGRS